MSKISKIRLNGQDYPIDGLKKVELTQSEYDALDVKNEDTLYLITDAEAVYIGGSSAEIDAYTKDESDKRYGTLEEQNQLRSDVEDVMGEVASLEADKQDKPKFKEYWILDYSERGNAWRINDVKFEEIKVGDILILAGEQQYRFTCHFKLEDGEHYSEKYALFHMMKPDNSYVDPRYLNTDFILNSWGTLAPTGVVSNNNLIDYEYGHSGGYLVTDTEKSKLENSAVMFDGIDQGIPTDITSFFVKSVKDVKWTSYEYDGYNVTISTKSRKKSLIRFTSDADGVIGEYMMNPDQKMRVESGWIRFDDGWYENNEWMYLQDVKIYYLENDTLMSIDLFDRNMNKPNDIPLNKVLMFLCPNDSQFGENRTILSDFMRSFEGEGNLNMEQIEFVSDWPDYNATIFISNTGKLPLGNSNLSDSSKKNLLSLFEGKSADEINDEIAKHIIVLGKDGGEAIDAYTKSESDELLKGKQDKMSGNYLSKVDVGGSSISIETKAFVNEAVQKTDTINFKTINGNPIFGMGDIKIEGGGNGETYGKWSGQTISDTNYYVLRGDRTNMLENARKWVANNSGATDTTNSRYKVSTDGKTPEGDFNRLAIFDKGVNNTAIKERQGTSFYLLQPNQYFMYTTANDNVLAYDGNAIIQYYMCDLMFSYGKQLYMATDTDDGMGMNWEPIIYFTLYSADTETYEFSKCNATSVNGKNAYLIERDKMYYYEWTSDGGYFDPMMTTEGTWGVQFDVYQIESSTTNLDASNSLYMLDGSQKIRVLTEKDLGDINGGGGDVEPIDAYTKEEVDELLKGKLNKSPLMNYYLEKVDTDLDYGTYNALRIWRSAFSNGESSTHKILYFPKINGENVLGGTKNFQLVTQEEFNNTVGNIEELLSKI